MQNWAILCSTVVELFNSLPTAPVLRTFVQYLIAFCGRPEAAGDVISGVSLDYIYVGVLVKFGDYRPSRSRDV